MVVVAKLCIFMGYGIENLINTNGIGIQDERDNLSNRDRGDWMQNGTKAINRTMRANGGQKRTMVKR